MKNQQKSNFSRKNKVMMKAMENIKTNNIAASLMNLHQIKDKGTNIVDLNNVLKNKYINKWLD